MSDGIQGVVVGDAELAVRFGRVADRIETSVVRRLLRVLIDFQRVVKGKLSGPVLKNRTGHLRGSISYWLDQAPGAIGGNVGIPQGPTLIYGRAHEYGHQGPVTVRAHLRTIKQAFGHALAEAKQVTVRSHQRNMNVRERSFLRSTLAEQRDEIVRELAAGVSEGLA